MNKKLYTDTPIHPGFYIKELWECSGLTLYEFSQKVNIKEFFLQTIMSGNFDIDEVIDERISCEFRIPPKLLLNMQKDYNDNLEHNKQKKRVRYYKQKKFIIHSLYTICSWFHFMNDLLVAMGQTHCPLAYLASRLENDWDVNTSLNVSRKKQLDNSIK
jgi:plasmid maintenance system antidote protein VapI